MDIGENELLAGGFYLAIGGILFLIFVFGLLYGGEPDLMDFIVKFLSAAIK